jgi:tetratricopeptide (TPR) repeat protein
VFRLIGIHPGPDISAPAAASLAALPLPQTQQALSDLVRAHLLTSAVPGRFGCHDLLRAYAAELANHFDTSAQRRSALHRALDHYLHTGQAGAHLLHRDREQVSLGPGQPGVTPEDLADYPQAVAWFAAEHQVLRRTVVTATGQGFDQHAWQIPWTLACFLDRQGYWHEWIDILTMALAATQRCGGQAAQAGIRRDTGRACMQLGRLADARGHLLHALGLFQVLGDQHGQARVYLDLAVVAEHLTDYQGALRHSAQAAELFLALGNQRGHARALNSTGWNAALLGDHQRAITCCQQAVTVLEEAGDIPGLAATLDSLGFAHFQAGDYQAAIACYERSLALTEATSQRLGVAEVRGHLGDAHLATGDAGAAAQAWQRALVIMVELDHRGAAKIRAKLAGLTAQEPAPAQQPAEATK